MFGQKASNKWDEDIKDVLVAERLFAAGILFHWRKGSALCVRLCRPSHARGIWFQAWTGLGGAYFFWEQGRY